MVHCSILGMVFNIKISSTAPSSRGTWGIREWEKKNTIKYEERGSFTRISVRCMQAKWTLQISTAQYFALYPLSGVYLGRRIDWGAGTLSELSASPLRNIFSYNIHIHPNTWYTVAYLVWYST